MTTIQMVKSDAGEVMHLFEVMTHHGVSCGLEMKVDGSADPLLGIPSTKNVRGEYIEGSDGDSVVIHLDNAEFAFELGKHRFFKYISDCQIDISIDSTSYTAWFSSGVMSSEAIEEAISYDPTGGEFEDKVVELNIFAEDAELEEELQSLDNFLREGRFITGVEVSSKGPVQKITLGYNEKASYVLTKLDNYEMALLTIIRNLKFDDLLDAYNALESESGRARSDAKTNQVHENGFKERASNLLVLAEVLAAANADYRVHCEIK